MECLECGSNYSLKRDSYVYHDDYIGKIIVNGIPYYQCECGSVLLTEEMATTIEDNRRRLISDYLGSYPVSDYLTASQTALKLGITRQALHKNRRINRGFIYFRTLGECKVFLKQSVEMYLKSGDGRFPLTQTNAPEYIGDTVPLTVAQPEFLESFGTSPTPNIFAQIKSIEESSYVN